MRPMMYSEERKSERIAGEVYRGYEYAVINRGWHPCCYIKIPEGHLFYKKDYDDIDLDVHGGLTFAGHNLDVAPGVADDGFWIGWDYAHWGDYVGFESYTVHIFPGKMWSVEELVADCKAAIDQIVEVCEE